VSARVVTMRWNQVQARAAAGPAGEAAAGAARVVFFFEAIRARSYQTRISHWPARLSSRSCGGVGLACT